MSAQTEDQTGDLKTAVSNAMQLLGAGEAQLAREQAQEILQHYPDETNSQFVVAAALRAQGHNKDALERLQVLVRHAPDYALAQQELGFAYADAGELIPAIHALQQAIAIESKLPASWKLMGELFLADGDDDSATEAFNQFYLTSAKDPDLVNAVKLTRAGKIGQAERLCRKILKENPSDVTAIRLLADIGIKAGVLDDAQNLLERCLELAPDFRLARLNYAGVLSKREKLDEALEQINQLLVAEPNKFTLLVLQGSILAKIGDYEKALPCYEYLMSNFPARPRIALSYGHALKTIGQLERSIAAYRQAIELQPSFGDAYWSLANLKTFKFQDRDIEAMRHELDNPDCGAEDYFHLCFALGKAYEHREHYDESFQYYKLGNDLKEKLEKYEAGDTTDRVHRTKTVCTREFFSTREHQGCDAADPIFIVGLPRSGSTLLEQILASHSLVDGTKELPHIPGFVQRVGKKRKITDESLYPEILREMSADKFRELGKEYMDRTRIQRGSAPNFIDKMPNNFFHVGLIHLILPAAKIIDARRHPMATCFSTYSQLFARGQRFTYGLTNVGRYYCDYVELMDHWDEVLPGKVLRVQYEDVVNDTESQIRRILDYCCLPFEQSCLEFYRTDRAIRTPSSEQVRRPIYRGGLEMWRNYEAHLDALKDSLGPVLNRYPID